VSQAACRGGSLAVESLAAFAWNGWQTSSGISGNLGLEYAAVLVPYLGQNDSRLKYPPDNLVSREDAYAYPTDFSAMPEEWIEKLSRRGEQLTKALIAEHHPELAKPSTARL